jgi:subtilisin family serine protease
MSNSHRNGIWCAAGMVAFLAAQAVTAQDDETSKIPLPSAAQQEYLAKKPRGTTRGPSPVITANLLIEELPQDSWFATMATGKVTNLPLRSANELLILLSPELTGPEIENALKDNNLELIDAAPQIGAITVDASARLGSASVPTKPLSVDDVQKSPLNVLASKLAEDPRFVVVTPNAIVGPFGLRSAIEPTPLRPRVGAAIELTDWGVEDAKFDAFWADMKAPFAVGVIDVGFGEHEDLSTHPAVKPPIPSANHGNHVAGIMCAQHNGIGMKGALKDCVVHVSAGRFLLTDGDAAIEGTGAGPFKTLMSEYVATVLEFMDEHPDVGTINLSLGYNWMPNFGIDPRGAAHDAIRNEVRGQGRFFAAILAHAKRRGVALVSAAGNDSSALQSPLEASWASPFNFGNALVREKDGWTNGLVVQAHDAAHKRAGFSNVAGQISCPGVDISSLLAAKTAYGKMSGTSMASPYCAAGLALVRALRADLSLRDAIGCVTSSPDLTKEGVPRLNLEYSIRKCKSSAPPKAPGM